MKIRSLCEAAGVSLLVIVPQILPLITPGLRTLFHHNLDMKIVVLGIALDLVCVFLIYLALLGLLSRLPVRVREIAEACIAGCFIGWAVQVCGELFIVHKLFFLQALGNLFVSHPADSPSGFPTLQEPRVFQSLVTFLSSHGLIIAVAIVVSFGGMAWVKRGSMRSIVQATRFVLACLAFCAFWIVPDLYQLAVKFHTSPNFSRSAVAPLPESDQRIVWILLDELSYNLTFDHPPSDIRLPNLQHFRSQSVSFSSIEPVGAYTDLIISSLLINRKINKINTTFDRSLLYRDPVNVHWQIYDAKKTLFSLANSRGWNPAVAGWYNPYCELFSQVLTACTWKPYIDEENPSLLDSKTDKSITAAALVFARDDLSRIFPKLAATTDAEFRQRRISEYQSILSSATEMVHDGHLRFVFIHLPVPHPPGIYDRHSHKLCNCGNYFDNLTLADDTLKQLLGEIGQTPWVSETTVIVSSDHSWRLPLWQGGIGWTPEEQRVSHGQFDQRPVFLVHFPGQAKGNEISANVPELKEHDIIAAMLEHKIENPESLEALLSAGN